MNEAVIKTTIELVKGREGGPYESASQARKQGKRQKLSNSNQERHSI